MTSVSSFFLPKHDYIIKLNIVKRLQHRTCRIKLSFRGLEGDADDDIDNSINDTASALKY